MRPGASQLTLEQFASIAAALEAGVPRDEELASRGLSNEAWESERERWLSRLAAQAASGNVRSSVRYAELLRAQTTAAAKRAKGARLILDGATPAVPAVKLAQVVGDTRSRLVPSALREPLVPVLAPPVPVPVPKPTKKQTVFQMDAVGALSAAAAPVLPFQPASPARPAKPAESSLRQTRVFDAPPAARPALPFAPTPGAPSPTGPITARTSGRAPGPVLPFLAAGAGPAAKSTRAAESFTLAEYAKICATVRAFPDHVAGIRSHYGLDIDGWKAMHALWQARFDKDPALKGRWQMLVDRNLQSTPR